MTLFATYKYMEVPRDWRMRTPRKRFATKVVADNKDWSIVEGFGSNLWAISKNGQENFVLPEGRIGMGEKIKGEEIKEPEKLPSTGIIYQSQVMEKV